MNHGGTRENVSERAGANDFGREVAKVAVAQICDSLGFQGFKESALDSLTELAIRYMCNLGKTASLSANLAGRRECSVFDIMRGFQEFSGGAFDVKDCLAGSGTVKELMEYVSSGEEVPYAQPVPQFPVLRDERMIPSFMQMEETPPGKHIPAWLPAFPDPHTYIHTPMWNEREMNPRADKVEQARQRRKAERSLLSLQQRLVSHGPVESSSSSLADKMEDSETLLHPGVEGTGEGHVSVLEAFAPAIEAVKGGFSDDGDGDGDGERRFVPDKRLIKSGKKKTVGECLDLNLKNKGKRPVTWVARDDEKDDKKRRAEYILRQSMGNPQDLMQL